MAAEWLTWALLCASVWGLGTLASKPATDRYGSRLLFLGSALAEGAAFGILGLILPRDPVALDAAIIALALAAGAAGVLGYLCFYEGMRRGSVGFVGTITAAYPVVTVLLSLFVLNEELTHLQGLGIVLTILCVVLLAYEGKGAKGSSRPAIILSLLGFLAWGAWGFLAEVGITAMGEGNLFLLYAPAYLAIAALYFLVRKLPRPDPPTANRFGLGLALVSIVAGFVGAYALNIAYKTGPASLVTPVSGSYPIIATVGAVLFLRERMGIRLAAALASFGVGLFLLSGV